MRPTVEQPLRSRGVEESQVLYFLNRELLPFAQQARQALNYTSVAKATLTTDGSNTATTIWTSPDIAVGTAVMIEASVTGRSASNRSAFKYVYYFYNQGTLTQEGLPAAIYSQDAAGYNVALAIVDNHLELNVTDPGGGIPFEWVAIIEAQVVP